MFCLACCYTYGAWGSGHLILLDWKLNPSLLWNCLWFTFALFHHPLFLLLISCLLLPPPILQSPHILVSSFCISIYCSSNQMSFLLILYGERSWKAWSSWALIKAGCCLGGVPHVIGDPLVTSVPWNIIFSASFSLCCSCLQVIISSSLIWCTIVPMTQLGATLKL